ncbi:MAG TPA: hypothetical protein VMC09_18450 [Anaerolineales bacterium]|nr:hypothetical protein [Anaerolineales bacterium]
MIDIEKILKRAWHILWNYKVLWIFGILLVLTAGGRGSTHFGSNSSYRFNDGGYQGANGYHGLNPSTNPQVQQMNMWFQQNLEPLYFHPAEHIATFVWIGVALLLFCVIIGALFALVRYPAEAAVIRMVDGYEQNGEKVGFGAGWKLGWNHRAFRMWWIDFLIQGLPGLVLVLLIGGLVAGIVVKAIHTDPTSMWVTLGASILAMIVLALVFGLGLAFLRLLRQFFWRKLALNDLGTRAAFQSGWAMFKRNWKSGALMWLVLFGLGIGFFIAYAIALFILIPIFILLCIPALIVAVIPGLMAFGIASLFASPLVAAIIGGICAVPFFFLVVGSPLLLLQGWFQIYESTVWTLTFREINALESVAPAKVPAKAS